MLTVFGFFRLTISTALSPPGKYYKVNRFDLAPLRPVLAMGDYRSNVDRPPAKKMCVSVANSEYSGYSEYADQESSNSDLSQVQNRGRYVPPYSAHMPSKQNSFTKRNRLAVNNRAAPLGSSFKPQDKNDSAKLYRKNNVDVISAKLNVSCF